MGPNSLSEIINGAVEDPVAREGDHYNWKRMTFNADGIRNHHEARTKVADVEVSGDIPVRICNYAERLRGTTEAWEYSDGTILICAVCDEFAGAFVSHSNTEIHFFLLTPKKKKK